MKSTLVITFENGDLQIKVESVPPIPELLRSRIGRAIANSINAAAHTAEEELSKTFGEPSFLTKERHGG